MRHALTLALQDYDGGVILVSHDRALLRASCDKFVLVADAKSEEFDGDLDDYKNWLSITKVQENAIKLPENIAKKQDYAQSKADRQARLVARRPLIKETEQIERQLEKVQAEKAVLDTRAAESSLYDPENKAELQKLLKSQAELTALIDELEMRWLELHESLEALPEITA